jgi:hypothetical protein
MSYRGRASAERSTGGTRVAAAGPRTRSAAQQSRGLLAAGPRTAEQVLQLQREIGNQAVMRLFAGSPATAIVMRDFEDDDKVGEDAVGVFRGFAQNVSVGKPKSGQVNQWGLIDGTVSSGVEPHAFTDKGKTGDDTWIHAGGSGGAGNENTGEVDLVAPVIKSRPPKKAGGLARAWVKKGTGTVKVKRSYKGVVHGLNGVTNSGNVGQLWMSPRAQDRIDKHERKHVDSTEKLHDKHLVPLERRVWLFSGFLKATKSGADQPTAEANMLTRLDWNKAITDFQNDDTAENQPMGTTDTKDMNTSDFYKDYETKPKFKQKTGADIYEGVGRSRRGKSKKHSM